MSDIKVDPKVLADNFYYHWRDAANKPFCNMSLQLKVQPLSQAKKKHVLCRECNFIAEKMADGFQGG